MTDKRTVTHVDMRSSKDLRGPVIGLQFLSSGKRVVLMTQPIYTVGSDEACDVVVRHDPHVSAVHCILERRGDDLFVLDQQSKNGVWVNDARVQSSELGVRATLRVGNSVFLAYGPGIQDDDFATPSRDSFIRGQIADYGGNAARAAQGLGIHPRTAQRAARDLEAASIVAAAQRATIFEDSVPVPVDDDSTLDARAIGRKRRGVRRPLYLRGVPILPPAGEPQAPDDGGE